jgi:hypothetical protein
MEVTETLKHLKVILLTHVGFDLKPGATEMTEID